MFKRGQIKDLKKLAFKNKKNYLFSAPLGLCCCAWAFSSCSEQGLLFTVVHSLLIRVASFALEHGLQSTLAPVVGAHRLSCLMVCGIFLEQGLNPCLLH